MYQFQIPDQIRQKIYGVIYLYEGRYTGVQKSRKTFQLLFNCSSIAPGALIANQTYYLI